MVLAVQETVISIINIIISPGQTVNVLLLSPVFAFELAVYVGNVFVKRYELLGDRMLYKTPLLL